MFKKALGIQSKILGESHGLVYLMPPTYGNQDFFNWLDDADIVEKWYGAEGDITYHQVRW